MIAFDFPSVLEHSALRNQFSSAKRKYEVVINDDFIDRKRKASIFITNFITRFNNPIKEAKLSEVNNLKKISSNWDGHGAIAVKELSMQNAKKMIEWLPTKYIDGIDNDSIFPNPNGTLTIEWKNDKNEKISMDIGEKHLSFFAKFINRPLLAQDNINISETEFLPKEIKDAFFALYK